MLLLLLGLCTSCCALLVQAPVPPSTTTCRGVSMRMCATEPPPPSSTRFAGVSPTLSLLAPSKINLFLRILRKREDGFHELASLFQTVSLMDTLDFWEEPADSTQPLCSMEVSADSLGREGIPTDETNLVMRALKLYADKTGETRRIHCRLHKAVPAQAGLGGGSGDAATALFAANQLAGFPASDEQLIEWSGELGSDISFFFSQGTAYCTGRGEIIEPVPPLPPTVCTLVKPKAGLSTPAVFKELGLQPGEAFDGDEPRSILSDFQSSVAGGTYVNDLEPPAFRVMPELGELRDALAGYGFDAVMMSGSGSTIFCVGTPSEASAATWREEASANIAHASAAICFCYSSPTPVRLCACPHVYRAAAQVASKYDVDIFEERFCQRPTDPKSWYELGAEP